MTKRIVLIISVIAGVTASGAAFYRSGASGDQPAFTTAAVSRGSVVDTVQATGTLEAVTTVQVGTQVSGTIKTIEADYNSRVRRGQVIARLEPSLFQTQVDQAEATVTRLEADVERARVTVEDAQLKLRRAGELWENQLIPRTDLETAHANARQAEASLKSAEAQTAQARASLSQARVNMEHTIIRAPIDGVVISRNVDVGQTVAASMSAPILFVIARDLTEMRVNARIDESDIGRVAAGQKVTFTVDAYSGQTFNGSVSQVRLEPITEQNVVSYVTIIDVANPGQKLKPGMTANVIVEIARADGVLRVPNAALRFRPSSDGSQVWLLGDDGTPRAVTVDIGITDGVVTAVTSERLQAQERVITGAAVQAVAAAQQDASPLAPRRLGGPGAGATGGNRQGRAGGAQ